MGATRGSGAPAPSPPSGRHTADSQRIPLTRDEVIATALRIIDARGFHELTMRGLARELGVFPAAVYWHAGTKAEVLGLVSEQVIEEIDLPDDSLDWQDWILELGHRARAVLGSHPRFASYFITNIQISGRMLVLADAALGTLYRAGFRGEDLVEAYNALFGAAFSWTAGEFADERETADAGTGEQEIATRLGEAPEGEFANLREHWGVIADRIYGVRWSSGRTRPMDSSFDRMLRTLVDGFAARLERAAPASGSLRHAGERRD